MYEKLLPNGLLMPLLPDALAVRLIYLKVFKRLPNLKHPRTFNEKIAWRKLYQHDNRFTLFADKIAAKREVAELIGKHYIIDSLWIGDNPNDIPFDELEPPYVIKTNHGSGNNIFVRDKTEIDRRQVIGTLKKQLKHVYGKKYREWAYIDIRPQILIEKMMLTPEGSVPEDFKFFVYDGQVHFIHVDYSRFQGHKRNVYSRDYRLLDVMPEHKEQYLQSPADPPANWSRMIEIAERIGCLFDFCRVDLYALQDDIKFGEVTFYPAAGFGKFLPSDWDETFGAPWKIRR